MAVRTVLKNQVEKTKAQIYLTKFIRSYRKAHPSVDIAKNWTRGDCLEKKLSEKYLFFYCKYILKVPEKYLDEDFHWDMCWKEQDEHLCDNCKHFSVTYLRRGHDYQCKLHKKETAPFQSCSEYKGWNGVKGGCTGINKMALFHRHALKTTILVVGYMLWCLCKDTNYTFLHLSQTEPLAVRNLQSVKNHIRNNPKIRMYWPELTEAFEHKDTKSDKNILHLVRADLGKLEASIEANSIDARHEGTHVDEVLFDDPIGRKHSESYKEMTKAKTGFRACLPLRRIDFPKMRYRATKWTPDDLTNDLQTNGRWDVSIEEICYIRDDNGDIEKEGNLYRVVKAQDIKRWLGAETIDDNLYIPYAKFVDKRWLLDMFDESKDDLSFIFFQYFNRSEGDPAFGFRDEWFCYRTEQQISREFYPDFKNYGVPWHLMDTVCCTDIAPGGEGRNISDLAYIVWSVDCFSRYYLRYSWIGKESVLKAVDRIFMIQNMFPGIRTFSMEKGKDYRYFDPYFELKLNEYRSESEFTKKPFNEPEFHLVTRTNIGKEKRILQALQPLYESNANPTRPKRVIHIGDKFTHLTYQNSLKLVTGEDAQKKRKPIDGPDAASDVQVVIQIPDLEETKWKMQRILESDPEYTMVDPLSEIARQELKEAGIYRKKMENLAEFGHEDEFQGKYAVYR
ncbi:MAG: hypothetical protein ACUZ8I_10405 [Candidatus Scalindua sp.]